MGKNRERSFPGKAFKGPADPGQARPCSGQKCHLAVNPRDRAARAAVSLHRQRCAIGLGALGHQDACVILCGHVRGRPRQDAHAAGSDGLSERGMHIGITHHVSKLWNVVVGIANDGTSQTTTL